MSFQGRGTSHVAAALKVLAESALMLFEVIIVAPEVLS